tara:strand:+ start:736 stop:1368 length:633 start_codon:yes stop_codon:yes gene_type:complete
MQNFVAIIDYGMGNIFSIQSALNNVGIDSIVTNDKKRILNAKAIILPGVGAFSKAMEEIKKRKIDKIIFEANRNRKLIIGICLGMQLLFEKSYENKVTTGLGLLKGEVISFSKNTNIEKKFNVGWNKIYLNTKNKDEFLANIKKRFMYFIHSYHVKVNEKNLETSYAKFGKVKFVSSVKKDNIYAYQFHPEKSAQDGYEIYKSIKKKLYY